jgi:hypothetical protein
MIRIEVIDSADSLGWCQIPADCRSKLHTIKFITSYAANSIISDEIHSTSCARAVLGYSTLKENAFLQRHKIFKLNFQSKMTLPSWAFTMLHKITIILDLLDAQYSENTLIKYFPPEVSHHKKFSQLQRRS